MRGLAKVFAKNKKDEEALSKIFANNEKHDDSGHHVRRVSSRQVFELFDSLSSSEISEQLAVACPEPCRRPSQCRGPCRRKCREPCPEPAPSTAESAWVKRSVPRYGALYRREATTKKGMSMRAQLAKVDAALETIRKFNASIPITPEPSASGGSSAEPSTINESVFPARDPEFFIHWQDDVQPRILSWIEALPELDAEELKEAASKAFKQPDELVFKPFRYLLDPGSSESLMDKAWAMGGAATTPANTYHSSIQLDLTTSTEPSPVKSSRTSM